MTTSAGDHQDGEIEDHPRQTRRLHLCGRYPNVTAFLAMHLNPTWLVDVSTGWAWRAAVRLLPFCTESRHSAPGQLKPQAEWPISAKAGSEADRRKTTLSRRPRHQ